MRRQITQFHITQKIPVPGGIFPVTITQRQLALMNARKATAGRCDVFLPSSLSYRATIATKPIVSVSMRFRFQFCPSLGDGIKYLSPVVVSIEFEFIFDLGTALSGLGSQRSRKPQ